MDNQREYKTLTQYLENLGKVVAHNFSQPEWVRCEVASIKKIGGHHYIEVIDISEVGDKIKSQTAIIYKTKESQTINKFKITTGLDLSKGMKVLFKLKVIFSAKFSLSLLVEDIDPSFTLGEMEIKINEIRRKIQENGYGGLNRALVSPRHFTKIAVISPDKAAGLADFMSEANFLSENKVCSFEYFPATFEGNNAKDSLLNAFKNVNDKIVNGVEYDCVVVIRGGGSKMSLHYLNEYMLAVCVCRTKVPVVVGIGHEIDKVVMDEYAHYSFDTPSKVIEYISNTIFSNYTKSVENLNSIEYMVLNGLDRAEKKVNLSIQEINNKVDRIIMEEGNKVLSIMEAINNDIISMVDYLKNKVNSNLIEIENKAQEILNSSINNKDKILAEIMNSLENKLLISEKDFRKVINEIKELSPENNLKRGYAIIRDGKRIVTSIEELKKLDKITIILESGEIELNIK